MDSVQYSVRPRQRPRVKPGPKPGTPRRPGAPQASGLIRDAKPTEAQVAMLGLLLQAYEADVAVEIGSRTKWLGDDVDAFASRTVARGLVAKGLARYSEPNNIYLLLTGRGRALVTADS